MGFIQKPGDVFVSLRERIKSKLIIFYRNNMEDIIYIMLTGIIALVLCGIINNWLEFSHLF